jgi:hypothetical protein
MSSFYLNEGWYSSEQLAEVLEANQKMNDHLAKAIGELPEGYTLTTHKVNPESLEGAAGSVVAMTQDNGVKLTFMQHPWVEVINEDGDVWILDPVLEVNRIEAATKAGLSVTPLYKKKEWVGLTDDEIYEAVENSNSVLVKDMARAIEAKLKEKNT